MSWAAYQKEKLGLLADSGFFRKFRWTPERQWRFKWRCFCSWVHYRINL